MGDLLDVFAVIDYYKLLFRVIMNKQTFFNYGRK